MELISILPREISKGKAMEKNTGKEMIIILMMLILILLCLVGFVFIRQDQKKQLGKIEKLEEEIQALEDKRAHTVFDREELEMKYGGTEEEAENTEEGQAAEGDQGEGAPSPVEGAQTPAGIDAVRETVLANISGLQEAGERWQVYACRFSDQAEEVVGSGRMTAASLIKLYIMGAVYEKYDSITNQNGKGEVDGLLRSMITVSDNNAANTLTGMLGQGDPAAGRVAVTDYCNRNGYTDTDMGRMLLETGTDRENYTSVRDCGMFLKKIYSGEIPYGEDMMNLLKQQERRGKIPAGVPQGVVVANKTGELDFVENDAAVVFKDNCPYILCVMSENVRDASAARQTIVQISSGVYDNM